LDRSLETDILNKPAYMVFNKYVSNTYYYKITLSVQLNLRRLKILTYTFIQSFKHYMYITGIFTFKDIVMNEP